MEAVRAGAGIDAADQLGEKLAVKVREQHADRVGALAGERTRAAMRDIIELVGDFENAADGRLGDRLAPVQDSRDRGGRDLRRARDVPNRHAPHRLDPKLKLPCLVQKASIRPPHVPPYVNGYIRSNLSCIKNAASGFMKSPAGGGLRRQRAAP